MFVVTSPACKLQYHEIIDWLIDWLMMQRNQWFRLAIRRLLVQLVDI